MLANKFETRIEQVTMLIAIDKDTHCEESINLLRLAMKQPYMLDAMEVIEYVLEPLELKVAEYE